MKSCLLCKVVHDDDDIDEDGFMISTEETFGVDPGEKSKDYLASKIDSCLKIDDDSEIKGIGPFELGANGREEFAEDLTSSHTR
jgi:hypothetical protein